MFKRASKQANSQNDSVQHIQYPSYELQRSTNMVTKNDDQSKTGLKKKMFYKAGRISGDGDDSNRETDTV